MSGGGGGGGSSGGDALGWYGFNNSMALTCCFNLSIVEGRLARLMESSLGDPTSGSTAASETEGFVVAGAGVCEGSTSPL